MYLIFYIIYIIYITYILHYIFAHYIYFVKCYTIYVQRKKIVSKWNVYIYNQLMKFSEEKIDRKDSKNPLIPKSSSISTIHHLYSASKVFDPEQSSPSLIADRN